MNLLYIIINLILIFIIFFKKIIYFLYFYILKFGINRLQNNIKKIISKNEPKIVYFGTLYGIDETICWCIGGVAVGITIIGIYLWNKSLKKEIKQKIEPEGLIEEKKIDTIKIEEDLKIKYIQGSMEEYVYEAYQFIYNHRVFVIPLFFFGIVYLLDNFTNLIKPIKFKILSALHVIFMGSSPEASCIQNYKSWLSNVDSIQVPSQIQRLLSLQNQKAPNFLIMFVQKIKSNIMEAAPISFSQSNISELKMLLEKCNKTIKEILSQIDLVLSEDTVLKKKISQIETEISILTFKRYPYPEGSNDLFKKILFTNYEIQDLEKKLKPLETIQKKVTERLEKFSHIFIESEINDLNNELLNSTNEINSIQSQINKLKSDITILEEKVNVLKNIINEQYAQDQNLKLKLEKELEEWNQKMDKTQKKFMKLKLMKESIVTLKKKIMQSLKNAGVDISNGDDILKVKKKN